VCLFIELKDVCLGKSIALPLTLQH